MALSGQVNKLAEEIKSAIVNGIETTGAVCTDGTPAYGGTGSGEVFDGFSVYALDIDDEQEQDEILDLPLIRFWSEQTPVRYFLDESAAYQNEMTFEMFVTEHASKTIDSTVHTRKQLLNWYLEQLEWVLIKMEVTTVTELSKRNPYSINFGRVEVADDFIYFGTTKLLVEYERQVS